MSKDKISGRAGPDSTSDDKSAKDTHYATLRRAHRDAKRERGEIPTPTPQKRKKTGADDWKPPALAPDQVFLYGLHTVRAALANPERKNIKLSTTQNALVRLEIGPADALGIPVEIVSPQDIDKVLGPEAIHQGVMLETRPLPVRRLEALKDSPLLLVLDQVTDPHNVGAIMRSAVAFDAGAVITTQRHSPTESGVMAKSASGALELIPYIQITNLADALGELHRLGFTTIGLDSEGPAPLEGTFSGDKIALVLGSEGKGLRQKTRETVNALARLDMPGAIKSLNVSNAAAIALYATRSYLKS
ncbi:MULTISPECIES: 23S rRNA (guanosine(2251)-2'-O)-methyltransferase RlmB [Rhizobium]|uniref:23S rRNA (Guanosine(2251)-2'-O)-methyltransferase RlmB n=1 Tax=Rhizobium tropici TaxID=398 RepID=A0A6P1C3M2_RHITR|nr:MULTISPECIES: 23S rRNA (guanosine(2251)-2'-O)-methyltransferase RlmB [Rhizobium]AGB70860.1 RNA methyltransferase [Rhizobium tropici CIAT 899]MBB4242551.1 23S rRNA (guanosine2251-2'-O)-methyltransferase [Rhizobium tropici]MBB5594194.1 23S rRNA (guanosine2251-2'-O)-methyltransferase [Rhizobium tropici]MBB6492685.1 23S rRNA (guanosine2251-2'-O)-methyltransferase [Rhizobium tropici]NEV11658.1 23S rRNA (guanosine(2251)-2'-O)-methyltransferase RlmB [Rhizobium tropici]